MRFQITKISHFRRRRHCAYKIAVFIWISLSGVCVATGALANDEEAESSTPERWNVHAQITHVTQWHDAFKSPYSGDNSLAGASDRQSTNDLTLYVGLRLWSGGELYLNPEIDQGFGLSNTLGVAGFPSGEAYKVGANQPYARLPRAFFRQTIDLGGESQSLESSANQLAGSRTGDNLVLTIGKFGVTDLFDTNTYAHDPRTDFMNWSIVEAGAFDYAADSWGYSQGGAVEWTQSWWTLRGGFFALSTKPNSENLDSHFRQYEFVGEFEERHQWWGQDGKLKLLGFSNHGKMASYADAVNLGRNTGTTPDVSQVRRMQSRSGVVINFEQAITPYLGMFARASWNDGSKEAFDFTEINQSVSGGLSLRGDKWGRHGDTVGLAMAINSLSNDARKYFSAGGMGILIGDGKLNYANERILETYYSVELIKEIRITADYQYITNPGYNRDRGPVSIYGLRAHLEF